MRILLPLVAILAVAACSGKASKQDKLDEAAARSTPEAAQNAAAEAQTGNTATVNNAATANAQ